MIQTICLEIGGVSAQFAPDTLVVSFNLLFGMRFLVLLVLWLWFQSAHNAVAQGGQRRFSLTLAKTVLVARDYSQPNWRCRNESVSILEA